MIRQGDAYIAHVVFVDSTCRLLPTLGCYTLAAVPSFWTLEDNKEVVISMVKSNQMEWWKSVVKGAPEIDTTKVPTEESCAW